MCRLELSADAFKLDHQLNSCACLVFHAQPLLQLTALTSLHISLAHLYPSISLLSALTTLRSLCLEFPPMPHRQEMVFEPMLQQERPTYGFQVNAHTGLFCLAQLTRLTLNGYIVRTLRGIEALSILNALQLGPLTYVTSIAPLTALACLTSLRLSYGQYSLRPLKSCTTLKSICLGYPLPPMHYMSVQDIPM